MPDHLLWTTAPLSTLITPKLDHLGLDNNPKDRKSSGNLIQVHPHLGGSPKCGARGATRAAVTKACACRVPPAMGYKWEV